jgi:hypothetical protein
MSEQPQRRAAPRLAFAAIVAVLLVALGVEAFLLLRGRPARPQEAQKAIAGGATTPIETFGDSKAPIQIEFYAPLTLDWHEKTIGLLRDYDKKHPGRIYVKLMPMGNSDCDTEMQKRGFTCAVIFINGQKDFTLPNGKKVMLEKKPNWSDAFYNSEDVITIVDQLAKRRPPRRSLWDRIKGFFGGG